jgi:hypothetical protein
MKKVKIAVAAFAAMALVGSISTTAEAATSTTHRVTCGGANTFRIFEVGGKEYCFAGHGALELNTGYEATGYWSGSTGGAVFNFGAWLPTQPKNKAINGTFYNITKVRLT